MKPQELVVQVEMIHVDEDMLVWHRVTWLPLGTKVGKQIKIGGVVYTVAIVYPLMVRDLAAENVTR